MCMVETRLGDERSVKWMNKLQDHLINPLVVSFLPYASVVIYLSIYLSAFRCKRLALATNP